VRGEGVNQLAFRGSVGEIPNKQSVIHRYCVARRRPTLAPNRSRLPGFKSSLNHVHLKIHHALDVIVGAARARNLPCRREHATEKRGNLGKRIAAKKSTGEAGRKQGGGRIVASNNRIPE
jgi:hypothetical protein